MGLMRSAVRHKLNSHTSFFWGLHRSAAEAMPHAHYTIKGSVDKNIEIEEDCGFRRSDVVEKRLWMSGIRIGLLLMTWQLFSELI